jgi:hypothetical protein
MRAVILLFAAAVAQGAGLRAGAARVEITPRGPIWMSGYASRNHPSTGVLQPLYARALAIDAGGGRVVIVTTDLVGLPRETADRVAERAHERFGIERARLLLNSSHTHTGPVVWPGLAAMFTLPDGEEAKLREYAAKLEGDLVHVIGLALENPAPAEISVGFGQAGFAMNRREPTPRGIRIGVNPAGPTDHEVPVIRVTGPDGKIRAILFAYACHNTTLTGDTYEISGDYAGFAEAKLEADHPGATAMFLQLCAGDQNPEPRGTVELAQRHGTDLATEVERVMAGALRPVRGPVRAAWSMPRLQFAPQSPSTYEADLTNPKSSPAVKRRAQAMLEHPVGETAYPVQAIRFGKDLTLLALGGEAVVDYALRAKREYPGEPLIVAAYSNGVMCYIASERMLAEGGYEVVDSMAYYGQPGPFAPGVEAQVFEAIRSAMRGVGRNNSGAMEHLLANIRPELLQHIDRHR